MLHDRELLGIESVVYNCAVRGVLAKNTVPQKVRGSFQKSLHQDLKNTANCPFALWFVPPGCLPKCNLAAKFTNFDCACRTAP